MYTLSLWNIPDISYRTWNHRNAKKNASPVRTALLLNHIFITIAFCTLRYRRSLWKETAVSSLLCSVLASHDWANSLTGPRGSCSPPPNTHLPLTEYLLSPAVYKQREPLTFPYLHCVFRSCGLRAISFISMNAGAPGGRKRTQLGHFVHVGWFLNQTQNRNIKLETISDVFTRAHG